MDNKKPERPREKGRKDEERETVLLNLAHISLQFSDTFAQKKHDTQEIFSREYAAITGTESGQLDTQRALRLAANEHGYTFTTYKSNWVSLRKEGLVRGSYFKGSETFVDNDLTRGRGFDLNVCWAGAEFKGLGHVTVMSSHYATKGDPSKSDPSRRVNVEWNRLLAQKIGELAKQFGEGKSLVFYGGDQNIVDRDADTFFGAPMTSVWDELGKWENTGHGNIDVIASYNRDGRVEADYIRALDDKELFMFTDHFPVEAGFRVGVLKS